MLGSLTIFHPPTPAVIVREGNELSWGCLGTQGLQKSPYPTGRTDTAYQSTGKVSTCCCNVKPAHALSTKPDTIVGPMTASPHQGVSELLGILEMLEMMPLTVGQQVWSKELNSWNPIALVSNLHPAMTSDKLLLSSCSSALTLNVKII